MLFRSSKLSTTFYMAVSFAFSACAADAKGTLSEEDGALLFGDRSCEPGEERNPDNGLDADCDTDCDCAEGLFCRKAQENFSNPTNEVDPATLTRCLPPAEYAESCENNDQCAGDVLQCRRVSKVALGDMEKISFSKGWSSFADFALYGSLDATVCLNPAGFEGEPCLLSEAQTDAFDKDGSFVAERPENRLNCLSRDAEVQNDPDRDLVCYPDLENTVPFGEANYSRAFARCQDPANLP